MVAVLSRAIFTLSVNCSRSGTTGSNGAKIASESVQLQAFWTRSGSARRIGGAQFQRTLKVTETMTFSSKRNRHAYENVKPAPRRAEFRHGFTCS